MFVASALCRCPRICNVSLTLASTQKPVMSKWGCIPAEAEDSQTVVEAAEADHHAGQGMWTQLWQFPHHHPTPNLLAHLHTPPHKVGHFFWPPAWCAAKGVVNFGTNRTATTLSAHICHRQDSPPGAERRWQNIHTHFYSAKRSVKFLKKRLLRFSQVFRNKICGNIFLLFMRKL